jgi:hypothetical protein
MSNVALLPRKDKSSDDDFLILKESKTRRLQKAGKEQAALVAYSGSPLTLTAKGSAAQHQKRRKYTKLSLVTAADAVRSLGTDAVGSDSLGIETDVSMDVGEESTSLGDWHLTEAPGVGSTKPATSYF